MIHYSCIGATGYVCGEVLRMMVNHPEGELVNVLDTYGAGDAISAHHPALRGFYDQVIMDLTEENVRETAKKSDVVMIQVPSGDVPKWAEIVLAEDCAIIDNSRSFLVTIVPSLRASMNSVLPFCFLFFARNQRETGICVV